MSDEPIRLIEVAKADKTAEIIPFPVREKPGNSVHRAIEQLHENDLPMAAAAMMSLTLEAYRSAGDIEFFKLVEATYFTLGRLIVGTRQMR